MRDIVSSMQSRIDDIERAQRADKAEVMQHIGRLYALQKARNNAVLERLGLSVQQDTLRSPSTWRPESSLQGRRIRPILEEDNRGGISRTNKTLEEKDPFTEPAHMGPFTHAPKAAPRRGSPLPEMTNNSGGAGILD